MQTDATLLDVTCCVRLHTQLHIVACCCIKFETGQTFSYAQTDATIPSIIGTTMYASSALQSPSENWANMFRLVKQQLCKCITFFVHFFALVEPRRKTA